MESEKSRCAWCAGYFEEYVRYHDEEWGVPVHDDRKHFEFLILEGAQAGLSWSTAELSQILILKSWRLTARRRLRSCYWIRQLFVIDSRFRAQ